jgi:hypothetical protein
MMNRFWNVLVSGLALMLVLPVMARAHENAPAAPAPPAAADEAQKKEPFFAPGKTARETVTRLHMAIRAQDEEGIATAFDWPRFTTELNKLLPDDGGAKIDEEMTRAMLVATMAVPPEVSRDLRVGVERKIDDNNAAVEVRRIIRTRDGDEVREENRHIHDLVLHKAEKGWLIYRMDSKGQAVPPPAKPVQRAPQGMVPAAGEE